MKRIATVLGVALVLNGCTFATSYGVHGALFEAESKIVNCELESALDTLQRFTVVGSNKEKGIAFEYMGVVYQEQMDLQAFNHTVDRFLFSEMGRGKNRQETIRQWNEKRREIRELRVYELGRAECATDFVTAL
ncbi:hypothetical protein [Enterovibrio coralii]|uniref:Lipoprotein n=1 Tax=Enterovibrio coralii TaxID=294935 RepID=A0A135I675_9GAMM|nr:hypothetical protein [Enterovibrio coralii]KXF80956.1 hypothetical protein ATN88_18070 [Enterovibrio coralii]